MSIANDDIAGRELLDTLLASETRADLLTLFHQNPGLMDTPEGIALRIGSSKTAILQDLQSLVKIGILVQKKIGTHEVISLDAKRDREIQESIATHLKGLKS
ncbi:MAG: hypothetical protein ACYC7D_12425 [Nitrososphaerales archaeon]